MLQIIRRLVPAATEAAARARAFFESALHGDARWWMVAPNEWSRGREYWLGKITVALVLLKPRAFKKVTVEALDGDGVISIAKLALGKKWLQIVADLNCEDVKYLQQLASVVFEGQLHTFQLFDGMSVGRAIFEAERLHADIELQRSSAMGDYEALVAWVRNPDLLHHARMTELVEQLVKPKTAIVRSRVEAWVSDPTFTVEEYLAWDDDEKSVVETLASMFRGRRGTLLGDEDERRLAKEADAELKARRQSQRSWAAANRAAVARGGKDVVQSALV